LIGEGHQSDLAVGISNFISDKINHTDGI
jgi:hypothetical protein